MLSPAKFFPTHSLLDTTHLGLGLIQYLLLVPWAQHLEEEEEEEAGVDSLGEFSALFFSL